jgi:hypothetical protein
VNSQIDIDPITNSSVATSTVSREMSVIIKEAACNEHIQQQGIAKGTANMRTIGRVNSIKTSSTS